MGLRQKEFKRKPTKAGETNLLRQIKYKQRSISYKTNKIAKIWMICKINW